MKFSPANHHDRETLIGARSVTDNDLEKLQAERHLYQTIGGAESGARAVVALHLVGTGRRLGMPDALAGDRAIPARLLTPQAALIRDSSCMPAGCTGDCCDSVSAADCTCGHAQAWRAPRQPRKPAPREPWLARLLASLPSFPRFGGL